MQSIQVGILVFSVVVPSRSFYSSMHLLTHDPPHNSFVSYYELIICFHLFPFRSHLMLNFSPFFLLFSYASSFVLYPVKTTTIGALVAYRGRLVICTFCSQPRSNQGLDRVYQPQVHFLPAPAVRSHESLANSRHPRLAHPRQLRACTFLNLSLSILYMFIIFLESTSPILISL